MWCVREWATKLSASIRTMKVVILKMILFCTAVYCTHCCASLLKAASRFATNKLSQSKLRFHLMKVLLATIMTQNEIDFVHRENHQHQVKYSAKYSSFLFIRHGIFQKWPSNQWTTHNRQPNGMLLSTFLHSCVVICHSICCFEYSTKNSKVVDRFSEYFRCCSDVQRICFLSFTAWSLSYAYHVRLVAIFLL